MATSTIINNILDPVGDPIANATIIARLRPGTTFQNTTGDEIAREVRTETDGNGQWTLELERNEDITPTGTYYEIEEQLPNERRKWAIVVRSTDQSLFEALINFVPTPGISVADFLTATTHAILPHASTLSVRKNSGVVGGLRNQLNFIEGSNITLTVVDDGTEYDITINTTGVVLQSLIDAKGDLLTGTADNTLARKAVGANGTLLVADSTQADGLIWRVLTNSDLPADTVLRTLVDAKGDLLTGTADNTLARKAVGANGQLLVADATQVDGLLWRVLANGDLPADVLLRTLADAKGDLLVASAADVIARLPVGTNDFVLTADSTQALGVKWAAVAGSGSVATDTIWDAAGDLAVGSGSNTAARKAVGSDFQHLRARAAATNGLEWATLATAASVSTDEGTTSGSYTDLATTGPAVTVTTGTSVLVHISSGLYSTVSTSGAAVSVAVSGATTLAASDSVALFSIGSSTIRYGVTVLLTGLTAGENTFTLKYRRRVADTAQFFDRHLVVIPI